MSEEFNYICVAATPVYHQPQRDIVGSGNRFCGARPILSTDDCLPPEANQFENRGLAFWLVADHSLSIAKKVGSLFHATLTPAPKDTYRRDDQESDLFRVRPDSVMGLDGDEFCEIVRIPGANLVDLQQALQTGQFKSHRPLGTFAILRCGNLFTAPMRIEHLSDSVDRSNGGQLAKDTLYNLLPNPQFSTKFREMEKNVLIAVNSHYFRYDVLVLPDSSLPLPPGRWGIRSQNDGQQIMVEFAGPNFIKLLTSSTRVVSTLTLRQALSTVADEFGRSGARRELTETISNYATLVSSAPQTPPYDEIRALLDKSKGLSMKGLPELAEIATSLFKLPLIKKEFDKVVLKESERQFQQAKESHLTQIESELSSKRSEYAQLQTDIDLRKRDQDREISIELKSRFDQERNEMDARQKTLDSEAKEIAVTRQQVESNLSELVKSYKEVSPIITGSVLATLSVLSSNANPINSKFQSPNESVKPNSAAKPQLPILRPTACAKGCGITEDQFLARVHRIAAQRGMSFLEDDVKVLHVAIKSDPLVMLCGKPGVGKTSLARAYSDALGGTKEHNRLLEIAVHPNWIEEFDLFGYVHSIKQAFVPTSSGISPFLAALSEEYDEHGNQSPMTVILLDEMNLSQPEIYLPWGAIWHPEKRLIKLFDPSAVSLEDPLRACHSISLVPNLKFIGTINNDDTVKSLTPRFLDRVFSIEISSNGSGPKELKMATVKDTGNAIDAATFTSWCTGSNRSFPQAVAKRYEQLQQLVKDTRLSVLSHRTRDAIASFIANSTGLLDEEHALDCGVATRVVSQIRGAKSPQEHENLTRLQNGFSDLKLKLSAAAVETIILRDSWLSE